MSTEVILEINDAFNESIKNDESVIKSHEREWSFSIVGTGLGAGVLFLAINGGTAGLILFILCAAVCYPIAYISQRYIMNLILSSGRNSLSATIKSYTGKTVSLSFTYIYGIAVFVSILAFAAGLNSMIGHLGIQTGLSSVNLSTNPIFSFSLISSLTLLMMFGENLLITVLEKLSIVLMFALLLVSILLIPNWNLSLISQINLGAMSITTNISLLIPLLVFSVVIVPPLAPMVNFFKTEYSGLSQKRLETICYRSYKKGFWLLAFLVIIFSISCLLVMTPESLNYAMKNNISALSAMNIRSTSFYSLFLRKAGIVITGFALLTSYYGCGLGFVETIATNTGRWKASFEKKKRISAVALGLFIWLFVTFNFSVINIIGLFITPCVGYIYYLLPGLIIRTNPSLSKYKSWINFAVFTLGGFIIVSFIIGLFLKS
ncbi:MAG: hypothetical protein K9M56_08045 [Victivallales bacterium]|nr:hypothetical protein [Victivallales bacterium]